MIKHSVEDVKLPSSCRDRLATIAGRLSLEIQLIDSFERNPQTPPAIVPPPPPPMAPVTTCIKGYTNHKWGENGKCKRCDRDR